MVGNMLLFCPECSSKVPTGFSFCPHCKTKMDDKLVKKASHVSHLQGSGYHVGGFSPTPVIIGAFFAAGLILLMRWLLHTTELTMLVLHYYLAGMFIITASAYASRKAYSANFVHGVMTSLVCAGLLFVVFVARGYLRFHIIEYPPKDMMSIFGAGALAAGAIGGCIGLIGK